MLKKLCIAGVLTITAACGESFSGERTPGVTIDETFGGGTLRRSDGGVLPYRVGIFQDEGNYVVCAAAQNVRTTQDSRALNALEVSANGQLIQRGLSWAEKYVGLSDLDGKQAACRRSTATVIDGAEYDISLSRTRF